MALLLGLKVNEVSATSSTTTLSLVDSHPTSHQGSQESVMSTEQHHQSPPSRRVAASESHQRGHGSYDHRRAGRRNDQQHGHHGQNQRDSLHPSFFYPFIHPIPLQPNMPIMPLGASFVPLFPVMPPQQFELSMQIMNQINYYFSNENLVKDLYLRKKMDQNGWVHVNIISSFCLVKKLTNNKDHILDAVKLSPLVEVQGYKMRRRYDWKQWILPPSIQLPPL